MGLHPLLSPPVGDLQPGPCRAGVVGRLGLAMVRMNNGRLFLILAACLIPGCLSGFAATDQAPESKPATYSVRFKGLEKHPELAQLLPEVAKTFQRKKSPPFSRFLLVRRARGDLKRLRQALHSRGFFDAVVDMEVRGGTPPFQVVFITTPKRRYRLAESRLNRIPAGADITLPTWKAIGLVPGQPAVSATIIAGESALVQSAREQGFAFARMARRSARLDRGQRLLRVTFVLELGQRVRLGEVKLPPEMGVDLAFLRRRIPWKAGVAFHPQRLEEARTALVETGLFSVVRVQLAEAPDESGLWPLVTVLQERKHRTWTAGGGVSSDRGISLKGGWEHRNFKGAGERLRAKGELGSAGMGFFLSYDKPDVGVRGQRLMLAAELDQSEEEAYERTAFEASAGVTRSLFPLGGELSLTLSYRLSRVLELSGGREQYYGFLATPLGLKLDRRDDLFDAAQGWRSTSEVKPVVAISGAGSSYVRWTSGGSIYRQVNQSPRIVLALRAKMGGILGAGNEEVPADDRFYAGGGGSVRGYGYQLAGSVDRDGVPLGGRSLLEAGGEIRLRVTPKIGIVGFVDAGRNFATAFPRGVSEIHYGAGLGGRYVTPIGPLRLDVAVPLTRRDGVDDAFQIYVSIGQAF